MNDLDPPPSLVELVTSTYDPNSKSVNDKSRQDSIWKLWLNNLYEWMLNNMSKDFYFEVARGSVNGHSAANRVAHDANIGTTLSTVGEENQNTYTWSTTADIDTITSDSNSDTHDIYIDGLDANYEPVQQTVTLTGQTAATLDTPLMRINCMRNLTGTATLGTIYVWVSGGGSTLGVPNTAADIRSTIQLINGFSNERCTLSIYTIPAGKTGYIVFGKTTVSDSKAVEIIFRGRLVGGVFSTEHHIDIVADNYDYFFKLPLKMPEKSDLQVLAKVDSGTAEVSAVYDIILVDN